MLSPLKTALLGLCLVLAPLAQAAPAPDFEFEDTTLSELSKQKLVYLDFWASWCGPCRFSFPFMNELEAELGPKGFKVIAVNVDVEPDDAIPFLKKYPADFAIHYDPDGAIAQAYKVPGMPTSYLIRDGQILATHVGFRSKQGPKIKAEILSFLDAGQ